MKSSIKKFMTVGLTIVTAFSISACGGSNGTSQNSAAAPNSVTPQNSAVQKSNIKERILKTGIGYPEDHPQGQGMKKFKEIVEQKSGGKIKVQNFSNAILGDDQKMMSALKAGTQEIAGPSSSPVVGMVKEFGILDFPYLFKNEKEADTILDGPIGQKLFDKLPQQGLVGLAFWENGFRNLTNSKRPVAKVEDFKGLKIRTQQNKVHLDVFKKLGSNPTPMAFSEVFTALESKTVDGQENPLATILSSKFYEVQKYLSLTNHVYGPLLFLISKQIWDQMSPEEQKIVKDAAVEAGKYQRTLNREATAKAVDDLKSKGMQVNELPDSERVKMQEMIKPVIDQYSKEFGEDLVKEMYTELAKIRGQK